MTVSKGPSSSDVARSDAGDTPVTELRVHGVGGATPEELLGVPHTQLVAGGPDAGFFRPADWITVPGPHRKLEAYSWGGITSRSRTRALWLLLLPFALLNVAGWMHEGRGTLSVDSGSPKPRPPGAKRRGLAVAMTRLEAVVTTAVFTALISILTIEIIGYRCTAIAGCVDRWYLGPWRWWADDVLDGVAVGTAAAAMIMLAIAFIAGAGLPPLQRGGSIRRDPARRVGIGDDELWRRPDVARRLGMIHTGVALAVVSLFGAEAALRLATSGTWLGVARIAAGVTLVAAVMLLLAFGRAAPWAHWLVGVGALVVTLLTVIGVWRLPAPVGPVEGPVTSDTARIVFAVLLFLVLLRWAQYLWGLAVWHTVGRFRRMLSRRSSENQARQTSKSPVPPPVWMPSAGPTGSMVMNLRRWAAGKWNDDARPLLSLRGAVPVLGAGIAVAVGSGVLLQSQAIFGTDYPTEQLNLVAVFGLGWVAMVFLTATWVWFSHPGRTPAAIVDEDLSETEDFAAEGDDLWLRKISSAESAARITDRVETVVTVPAVVMLAAVIILAVAGDWTENFIDLVAGPAAWVLSLLPLGLMLAMNSLYRSRNFRRSLGIIWDVATLWPRWFHPWAPPSYGERAVPHLRRRIETLTSEGEAVILSAHSQGTVIAAAALAQLDPTSRRRVAVVTHGSPLARLYGRYFTEVFSVDQIRDLAEQLGPDGVLKWRNLYRLTDYIGGPVFADRKTLPDSPPGPKPSGSAAFQDFRVRDPHDAKPLMRGDPRPPTLNHSNYYADPNYDATINEYARRLAADSGPPPGEGASTRDL